MIILVFFVKGLVMFIKWFINGTSKGWTRAEKLKGSTQKWDYQKNGSLVLIFIWRKMFKFSIYE